MKSDINLLQKRKGKKYSSQKVATLLLGIALFAGAVYAGFVFPGNARTAAQLNLANVSSELANASGTEQDLTDLRDQQVTRSEQLAALTALNVARSDINDYLDAIEGAIPTSVNITSLNIANLSISMTGIAPDDDAIAVFCVRLRETGKFSNVFLQSSTVNTETNAIDTETSTTNTEYRTNFSVLLELPVTLDISGVLPEQAEETQTADNGGAGQ